MIDSQGLELSMSRIKFNGPKDVRAKGFTVLECEDGGKRMLKLILLTLNLVLILDAAPNCKLKYIGSM